MHAQRVRKFRCDTSVRRRLHAGGWRALSITIGSQVLLPNVRELHWHDDDSSIFPFIHLCTGTQIHTLKLRLTGPPAIWNTLLSTLSHQYPFLTRVNLKLYSFCDDRGPAYAKGVEAAVCGWNHLRSLSVDALSPKAWTHVATLDMLEDLKFQIDFDKFPPDIPQWERCRIFPLLRTLKVTSRTIAFSTALLTHMQPNQYLTSINLNWSEGSSFSQLYDLFSAMHDHCHHSSLTSMHVEGVLPKEGMGRSHVQPLYLKPTFAFSNLTDVFLDFFGSLDLDDESMRDIAMSWPCITCLWLGSSCSGDQDIPSITLLGLMPFAQYCPKLHHLTIQIDAENMPEMSLEKLVSSEALGVLNVLDSPLDDSLLVAAFLSDVFPGLKCIDASPHTNYVKGWIQVQDAMSVFVLVRSQERERARKVYTLPSEKNFATSSQPSKSFTVSNEPCSYLHHCF